MAVAEESREERDARLCRGVDAPRLAELAHHVVRAAPQARALEQHAVQHLRERGLRRAVERRALVGARHVEKQVFIDNADRGEEPRKGAAVRSLFLLLLRRRRLCCSRRRGVALARRRRRLLCLRNASVGLRAGLRLGRALRRRCLLLKRRRIGVGLHRGVECTRDGDLVAQRTAAAAAQRERDEKAAEFAAPRELNLCRAVRPSEVRLRRRLELVAEQHLEAVQVAPLVIHRVRVRRRPAVLLGVHLHVERLHEQPPVDAEREAPVAARLRLLQLQLELVASQRELDARVRGRVVLRDHLADDRLEALPAVRDHARELRALLRRDRLGEQRAGERGEAEAVAEDPVALAHSEQRVERDASGVGPNRDACGAVRVDVAGGERGGNVSKRTALLQGRRGKDERTRGRTRRRTYRRSGRGRCLDRSS
jgi:hypothetical protein